MILDADRRSPFNPLAGNPLRIRTDVAAALAACYAPLIPCISAGGGRVVIDGAGAVYGSATAGLEGFARPLWGLAPAAAGGCDAPGWWPSYARGLANGFDPAHPDHWGEAGPHDQRLVELAALAFALCMAPGRLSAPLDSTARRRLIACLAGARAQPVFDNNWKFFPVLIDLALRRLGAPGDPDMVAARLDEIDAFHVGDGWYRDGATAQRDHYAAFAFHFYGLLYAALAPDDGARGVRFRERAKLFAGQYLHMFADDGAVVPFGRSLIYRFAVCAFIGACAYAGFEALPWGVLKGLYLRHLRWWRRWPISRRDGILSVGFGYPNLLMAEAYNSPASPYWAFKAFLPLALPDTHPFWAANELPMPPRAEIAALPAPGLLIAHAPRHTIALAGGQSNPDIRGGAEKYAKFAYSSRYAFSVESERRFGRCSFDSMIGLADEDGEWRVREACEDAAIAGETLFARWRPWLDVTVETWLYWQRPWHIRIHRIRSPRVLHTIEGGFCLPREEDEGTGEAEANGAWCKAGEDFSGIIDLHSGRSGRVHLAEPNTNLLHPRTMLPQLVGATGAGETLLACAVLAGDTGSSRAAWATPPTAIRPLPDR